jgi:hypothetical protein
MAELALDDEQRDSLPGHLDGVGVPELVGSASASLLLRPARQSTTITPRRRIPSV